MPGKYLLTTLGCKVNQYDSQRIRETLEALGWRPAQGGEKPDIAVVNTCAVTATASAKSRQLIRRIACGGDTPVYVVGCGAGADAERIRRIHGVHTILDHSVDIPAELEASLPGLPPFSPNFIVSRPQPVVKLGLRRAARGELQTDHMSEHSATQPPRLPAVRERSSVGQLRGRIHRFAGHQRAFLKVQDGCDAFCTYCIVPRLRRELKSKPLDVALAEARALVRAGHTEIVVTGVYLGAYGRATALRRKMGKGGSPLSELVGALADVAGLERLRLSSLEPGDVDAQLLEVLASRRNCVPHLHLSLQSGSAKILRRMNRQYTPGQYVAMIDRARRALDQPAITTDVIVGFPGETEEDFRATLDLAAYACFSKIHAFPFSPREGTAAGRWSREFVHPSIVRERMRRLAEVESRCSYAYRQGLIGTSERVLVEGVDCEPRTPDSKVGHSSFGDGVPGRSAAYDVQPAIASGRADRYFEVRVVAEGARPGDLVPVRIDRVTPTRTYGVLQRWLGARSDPATPEYALTGDIRQDVY
ncbi:MAG: MiaB/RimO family radical SAM methylthiotransferase [Phycisphaerae bacterium]